MAHAESSNTGVVAIVAIMLMLVVAGFIAWRAGMFGGQDRDIDVDIKTEPVGSR